MSKKLHYDLCVIGGGLTGVSIARDAAGRGLSVLLVEAQDLAGATSSATSKFIHGGVLSLDKSALSAALRYLKENEILYRNASHLVRPVSCVVLEDRSGDKSVMGSALWRLKLWLYNRARVKGLFPKARKLSLENRPEDLKAVPIKFEDDARVDAYKAQEEDPKKKNVLLGGKKDKQDALPSSRDALLFSGLWVDDTRLVISHAIDAAQRGASILTYTTCEGVQARDGVWRVSLRDTRGDDRLDITASMVVNATGPWVSDFIDKAGVGKSDPDLPQLEFVRESHIILPRKYDGDHVYALRQKEGGVVYVAPYEEDYTLVGVSRAAYDPEKDGDLYDVRISSEEIDYLIEAYNRDFKTDISKDDVIFTYSAVRPVSVACSAGGHACHGSFIYHHKRRDIPLLSVYGGVFGFYRLHAQDVVDQLMVLSGRTAGGWSAAAPLAGADLQGGVQDYLRRYKEMYSWIAQSLLERYVRSYGSRIEMIVGQAECMEDLGAHYGDGVYEAELDYLRAHEWVFSAQDALWRRSKLALHISEDTEQRIEAAFAPGFAEEGQQEDGRSARVA